MVAYVLTSKELTYLIDCDTEIYCTMISLCNQSMAILNLKDHNIVHVTGCCRDAFSLLNNFFLDFKNHANGNQDFLNGNKELCCGAALKHSLRMMHGQSNHGIMKKQCEN